MTYKTLLLAAASAASMFAGSAAFAQEAPAADDNAAVEQLVVTGTRAPRVRLDSIAPVDVIGQAELARQATTETAQALANAAPSLDFPRPSITDGTDSVRPATLRGLSPDQTLVLVNGIRQHTSSLININGSIGRGSSAVDLNTIPMAAISTVEILRDGASAQYGSDAIAGVINLRLREARDGGNISASVGQYNTDVKTARIPQGYKKHDGTTWTISGWKGFTLGADGFLTISAEHLDRQPTSRADIDPRYTPVLKIRSRYGDAEEQQSTVYVNAGLPLNAVWSSYGWLGYQRREVHSAATGRVPNNVNNDPAVYPDGFIPVINPSIGDLSAAAGVRGEVGGFKIDANISTGDNKLHYRVINSINGTLIPNSPTTFDAGRLEYSQTVLGLDVLKPLSIASFKSADLAFGAGYRTENYKIKAGDLASYQYQLGPKATAGAGAGAQGFIGFRPSNATDKSRHSYAGYADLDMRPVDALDVDLAVRYENFSDYGSTTTGKLAARYDFTDNFAIRGAVSTGFRAPSLQQQAFTSTAINFVVINGISTPLEIVTLPPSDPKALALGAKPLQAEKSNNYSLGFVAHGGPFELTVDAYEIDINNRIVLSENLIGAPTGSATAVAIYNLLNPGGGTLGGGRFFINGVDSKTKGVDVIGRYRWDGQDFGRVNFTAAANFNSTKITRVPALSNTGPIPNPPSLFNRINVLSFEEGTPKTKVSLSADWSKGAWGALLKGTYYASIVHPFSNTDPAFDIHTGNKVITDIEGRYKFASGISLAAGVDNLFDQYPDATAASINTNGALAFSNYSPFGFNGRYLYTRLSYDF